jgi:hypothetical protein
LGAEIYLVDLPVIEADWIPLHPNSYQDFRKYEAAFELLEEDERMQVTTARDVPQDLSLFANPNHLNGIGADWLARLVAEVVREP